MSLPPRPLLPQGPPKPRLSDVGIRNVSEDRDVNEGFNRRQGLPPPIRSTVAPSPPTIQRNNRVFPFVNKRLPPGKPAAPSSGFTPKGMNALPLGSGQQAKRPSFTPRMPPGPRKRPSTQGPPSQPADPGYGVPGPSRRPRSRTPPSTPPSEANGASHVHPQKKLRVTSGHSSSSSPAPAAVKPEPVEAQLDFDSAPAASAAPDSSMEWKAESPPPANVSQGEPTTKPTLFVQMRPECVQGVPGYMEAREAWRNEVTANLALKGKLVVRTLIRADGMAVDLSSDELPSLAKPGTLTESSDYLDQKMSPRQEPMSLLAAPPPLLKRPSPPRRPPVSNTMATSRVATTPSAAGPSKSPHPTANHRNAGMLASTPTGGSRSSGRPGESSGSLKKRENKQVEEKLPIITPVIAVYNAGDAMIRMFITQFFRLFDGQRPALYTAYEKKATFSYQVLAPVGTELLTEGTTPCARNLSLKAMSNTDLDSPMILKEGPRPIITFFKEKLKDTVHGAVNLANPSSLDPDRFVWDVTLLPGEEIPQSETTRRAMMLVCHGDLAIRGEEKVFCFDRSFILKENNSGYWPYLIHSDQLTIRSHSKEPPWNERTDLFKLVA